MSVPTNLLHTTYAVGQGVRSSSDAEPSGTAQCASSCRPVPTRPKHACADTAMHGEVSRSQLLYAAAEFRAGHGGVAYQASVARVIAARAASDNARMAIQLHGGNGYTWEHDLHLAAKRATVLALQLGSRDLHLSRVLEMEDA